MREAIYLSAYGLCGYITNFVHATFSFLVLHFLCVNIQLCVACTSAGVHTSVNENFLFESLRVYIICLGYVCDACA